MITRKIQRIGYIQALVAIGFTIMWGNLLLLSVMAFAVSLWLFVGTAFLVPIFLLVQNVQYNSHRAYFMVITLLLTSMLKSIGKFSWQLELWIKAKAKPTTPTCIVTNLNYELFHLGLILGLGALLLSLMHTRRMAETYQWNKRSFLLAVGNALLLWYLLRW